LKKDRISTRRGGERKKKRARFINQNAKDVYAGRSAKRETVLKKNPKGARWGSQTQALSSNEKKKDEKDVPRLAVNIS